MHVCIWMATSVSRLLQLPTIRFDFTQWNLIHIFLCHSSNIRTDIAQGTKDLAVASAGVNSYGVNVDGAVKSPISNAVEVIDEAAEAGRGINSYGTNVDHRLGHELEAH